MSHGRVRPMGWRRLLLLPIALLASLAVVLLARTLAQTPDLDARWRLDATGHLQMIATDLPWMRPALGHSLEVIVAPGIAPLFVDGRRVVNSTRWIASDEERDAANLQQRQMARLLQPGVPVVLGFTDRMSARVTPHARGYTTLGITFWLLCGLGLALELVGAVVILVRQDVRTFLFAVMAQCQAAQLLLAAVDAVPGIGNVSLLGGHEAALRMALDVITCAALLNATLLYPTPLPPRRALTWLSWMAALVFSGATLMFDLPQAWWWCEALELSTGLLVMGLLGWSYRITPHPYATVVRRLSIVTTGSLALVTIVVALNDRMPGEVQSLVSAVPVIWTVFFASLLLMSPFLARSQHMMREFAMLAGVSTLATSVDLLFVAVFSFNQFASITTSLFVALGVYAASRQWLLDQMIGARAVTTERLFEHLLRIARKVEEQPERAADWQLELFHAVFQPLVARHEPGYTKTTRWYEGGAGLLVPLAVEPTVDPTASQFDDGDQPEPRLIVLRFAERGKRLFTAEDARLADRIVEQLRRAVAHDRAIEQGRSEERGRIAQDLHDDIGARLLTLMYKAPNSEMEDYVRHTLQDLKTLTRGLAATTHFLSHASGEWKADIAQRLAPTGCTLDWSFTQDVDIQLNVVQWSGLTRILRELVSNIIAHAKATHTTIHADLKDGMLKLTVADNGVGGTPKDWSTGLGLGGIRKRVRMLGGTIAWQQNTPDGVRCDVSVPLAVPSTPPSQTSQTSPGAAAG
ncbi:sensor histidine kinase [Scleromatobacter humisilvae]|uniref:histidine kinase n=1 Tax=Scleromatobacter humisilvae TaxID=2897159 RepID=A0A9X2C2F4_9BURK|nr:ATP-binding protein [Scleromatobacter humisilvae]MCK9686779.1 histidine kinase [Scleromatobacter humisilvae]